MDCVYKKFLDKFSRGSHEIENKNVRIVDFFNLNFIKDMEFLNEKIISITLLNNGKYFISNSKTKGFVLEMNNDIESINDISSEYKELQKNIGKITSLFGFKNKYFQNISELFSNDEDSRGLGFFYEEFMERSDNRKILGNINIDRIFTIAYEANGNRIVLTNDNCVYIYAHDLVTHYYEKLDGMPKNTFHLIPQMNSLKEFVKAFFNDFISE